MLLVTEDCVQQHDDDSTARTTILTVFEVKVTGGLGGPQPHGVDNVVSVPGDWGVIGKSQNHLD